MLPMEEASVARGVARMPQERILIVEDEPDLRQVFVDILTSESFDTSTASDGEMAIQMLSENNYDLSLIDLYLPKADGFQVLAHLQRVSSSTSAIVMTGHGSIESAVEAMKKGAVDYLTKPVAFDKLRIVIKKALEVRQLQQENWLLRHQLKRVFKKLPTRVQDALILGHGTLKTLSHRLNRQRMGSHRTLCARGQAGRATGSILQARDPQRHL
jgi:DNA-binding NtrC family response regulator